ncbi:MAG TPA: thiamine phosphate synthase [Acidimicrobiales bacterium]|nr:thiamine phosphate synthase [Acidimicrobiales bacterium]
MTPLVVVVTDRVQAGGRGLVPTVAAALAGGAGAVLLRDKDLPRRERRALAGELRALTAGHGAVLVVAGDAGLARAVGADGVHLAAADAWPAGGDLAGLAIVGRSCHTVADLAGAQARGATWATYSPVYETASKPGYGPALGIAGLAAGCRAVPGLPVVALGGIGPGRARPCVAGGAAGVALMGAVMRSPDPGGVVRAVVDELGAAAVARPGPSGARR